MCLLTKLHYCYGEEKRYASYGTRDKSQSSGGSGCQVTGKVDKTQEPLTTWGVLIVSARACVCVAEIRRKQPDMTSRHPSVRQSHERVNVCRFRGAIAWKTESL